MSPGLKLLALALAASSAALADSASTTFGAEQLLAWPTVEFQGQTDDSLQTADAAGAGHAALRAVCNAATASGRILEQGVDLTRTPMLEWSWRVDDIYQGLDERSKRGDDYPARVYVVARRWPQWRSRVINYVWSSSQPAGSDWPNAYASQFRMVAVRSGSDGLNQWHTERRDVRADFLALHGIEIDSVDALAIMTDCDNAGQTATAWYGPIRWLSAP